MIKRSIATLTLALACLGFFSILGNLVPPAQAKDNKELRIAYVEWDCATASTYLAKAILEDKMGYKVDALPVTLPLMWSSIVSGDADVTLSAWLPETHRNEYAKVKDKVELLGILGTGARIGLVVPDYVPLRSIEELRDQADKFKKNIVGVDAGAGVVMLTEKAIKEYALPMEIIDGSGATMAAALREAIRREEWIVVTGWSPHWKFGRWKLHYLDDPQNVYGKAEVIYSVGRTDLKERHPDVWQFLKKMHYTDLKQFQTYMDWNQEKGATPEASARRFMKEYPELVAEWLKKD